MERGQYLRKVFSFDPVRYVLQPHAARAPRHSSREIIRWDLAAIA